MGNSLEVFLFLFSLRIMRAAANAMAPLAAQSAAREDHDGGYEADSNAAANVSIANGQGCGKPTSMKFLLTF
jgi:hypothetical protein